MRKLRYALVSVDKCVENGAALGFNSAQPRTWPRFDMRALLAALALAFCISASAAEVEAVRVWASPDYTRAVLDVSKPVEYKLFLIDAEDGGLVAMKLREPTVQ